MTPSNEPSHGLELAAVIALVGMVAVAAGVWAVTGLAALLVGDGWPQLGIAAVAHAVAALPTHLSDPRQSWPPARRAALPGAGAFYLALAVVLTAIALAAAAIARLRRLDARPAGDRPQPSGARWGSTGDLSPLRGRRRTRGRDRDRGRIALGYHGRRLLRGQARHALIAFGPPQSGKSAGLAIPALLEWPGPVVASSIKTDLFAATVDRREAMGEVMVFDPYGLSPAPGNTWSPLASATSWDGALSGAMRMTAAAEVETTAVKGGGYWEASAEQRLAPLLWAAARTHGGIPALVRWGYGQGDSDLALVLRDLVDRAADPGDRADAHAAYDAHLAFQALASETRSSIESTVQLLLRAYRSPRVQVTARTSEITPDRLLAGPHTLYLIGDAHRSKLLRPLFIALLQELVDSAYHQATLRGGRLADPLLLCLDELGNVAPLPNLAEIASTAPSHNIQLVSIFHDIAQAKTRYGDQARTVINSHRARMLLPGVADLETLRYFSEILGDQHLRPRGQRAQRGPVERRPLASPEQLRRLGDEHALLVYGRLAPTRLRLRMYYRDRRLQRLAHPDQHTT